MKTAFDRAWGRLKEKEGGHVNDARDAGGSTTYGVTEKVARANGYVGPMPALTAAQAREIAKSQYWDLLRLDEVAELSFAIASELLDSGYNCGIGAAGRWLQRCLNSLNSAGARYPDLTVDGVVGPASVAALRALLAWRGDYGVVVLLRQLNSLQGAHYIELGERRQTDEAFMFGWFFHRVEIPS